MAEKRTDVSREERGIQRRQESPSQNQRPFRMLERFADEMDRVFEGFGLGRGWPSTGLSRRSQAPWRSFGGELEMWSPDVEVFHRDSELVIRADLPGLSKDDVKVDVTDEGVIIQGERRKEHEEEREGVYRSERSYGSFFRMIPLPEGAMADQAKATFTDGVLEIAMPAPPEQARRGRRLEITEGAASKR